MAEEKTMAQRRQLTKAFDFLQRALQEPTDEFQRAAVIQGFEFTYELAWKHLKALVEENGGLVSSPRSAFREAAKLGIIDNPEKWFDFLLARNLTVHTYVEAVAEKVYAVAKDEFVQAIQALLDYNED